MKRNSRLLFLSTDTDEPSGGRKIIYKIVDILNENGFEAIAFHQKRNFRYTWFPNKTRVGFTSRLRREKWKLKQLRRFFNSFFEFLSLSFQMLINFGNDNGKCISEPINITTTDILVIPETRGNFIDELAPGVCKIILNQNPYFTFSGYTINRYGKDSPYYSKDVLGMIVLSDLNFEFQRHVFQDMNIYKVPLFIDKARFYYSKIKKPQIAYMPRRCHEDSQAVINMLKFRNLLKDFKIVAIDGQTEEEVAIILQDSLIFMSFSFREGFGLPAAEAMACGCIVIGYSGNGGEEFFKKDFSYKIKEGDLIAYTEAVEAAIDRYYDKPEILQKTGKMASDFIFQKYRKEYTEKALIEIFNDII